MGIRFYCPNGHKLNVKAFQAGRRGICPYCGASVRIPLQSTRPSSRELRARGRAAPEAGGPSPGSGAPPLEAMGSEASAAQVTVDRPAGPGPAAGGPGVPVRGAGAEGGGGRAFTASEGQGTAFTAPVSMEPAAGPGAGTGAPVGGPTAGPVGVSGGSSAGSALGATSDDPVAGFPEVVWYVRPPSGGQFGPASADVMRTWLEEGRVGSDSLVWREGWEDWQEAGQVFPELAEPGRGWPADPSVGLGNPGPQGSATRRPSARRGSNPQTRAMVVTVLVSAVIVLFIVFLYLLFG